MLIISLIAIVGALCWMVFTFAVYAVPAFVGLSAGIFAHQTGAGPLGAVAVGVFAGAATLVFGQRLIACVPHPALRFFVTALFAAPAGIAGYHAAHGILGMGAPSPAWHELLSVAGALLIGLTAWNRMTDLAERHPDRMLGRADVGGPVRATTKR